MQFGVMSVSDITRDPVTGYTLSVYPPATQADLAAKRYSMEPNGGTMTLEVDPHVRYLATQLAADYEGCAAGQWAITTDNPELALVDCMGDGTVAAARTRTLTLASGPATIRLCQSATTFCEPGSVTRGLYIRTCLFRFQA